MLAYLFWHRPYATTTVKQYEEALLRFQQHLGQQHARSGLRGRGAFSGT
jgi:site-specific recombinase XerD